MIKIISPTGLGLRNTDVHGSGRFHASRGHRKHEGVDFVCVPGQKIMAPVDGVFVRVAYPYSSDLRYRGALLESEDISLLLFYFKPDMRLLEQKVKQRTIIGEAQDISKKYRVVNGKRMTPHIHLGIRWVNPEVLLENAW